jgi:thiol-disulfide isomerase/thioredoxin
MSRPSRWLRAAHDGRGSVAPRVWVALVLALAGAGTALAASVGDPVPVCEPGPLGGNETVDLRAYRGRVLYVDFWASWCAPCRKAFPFMNALDGEFRDQGLQIVGINVDENAENARAFLARNPARFALAADRGGQCPRAFGVTAMPTSYLIDRNGVVRYVHLGFRPGQADDLRRRVEQLLAEPGGGR